MILYPSFGPGPHVEEVIYSALSAVYKSDIHPTARGVIFTDNPKPFASVRAEVVTIDPLTVESWLGPRRFIYRPKICALAEALRRFNCPVVMLDGDTFLLRSPQLLFNRVGPGRAVMHLAEGEIGSLVALGHERHRLSTSRVPTDEGDFQFRPDWVMWNSGVVGVHPADLQLVDAALKLSDAMHIATGHKNSEQMAFTEILSRNTTLHPCRDVVFHYYQTFIRTPFRARLHQLLTDAMNLPENQRLAWLYQHRPKPPLRKTLAASVKRPLKPFGFFKADLNTSV